MASHVLTLVCKPPPLRARVGGIGDTKHLDELQRCLSPGLGISVETSREVRQGTIYFLLNYTEQAGSSCPEALNCPGQDINRQKQHTEIKSIQS